MVKRTRRMTGGELSWPQIDEIINSHNLKPVIVNPESNFVVITYWWGRGNLNNNTCRPCPTDRQEIDEDEGITDYMLAGWKKNNPGSALSDADIKKLPEFKEAYTEELKSVATDSYGYEWKDPIKYEEMIENWKQTCVRNKCNYLVEEYNEFSKSREYQAAINAKPLFIAAALKACGHRGVLYIDGDMTINKFPSIFEMPGVDFMARGWNTDPRTNYKFRPLADCISADVVRLFNLYGNKYIETQSNSMNMKNIKEIRESFKNIKKLIKKENIKGIDLINTKNTNFNSRYASVVTPHSKVVFKTILTEHINGTPCFDPYTFETSGGTMFFASTPTAKYLLDRWYELAAEADNKGKADDRVLSLLVTMKHLIGPINIVPLPIEYLWLTMNYVAFLREGHNYNRDNIIIEHPECLTSEEAAADQGAASNRTPSTYKKIVERHIECLRGGGKFYVDSYFHNNPKYAETFEPFIEYLENAGNLATVVRNGFGARQQIVDKNNSDSSKVVLGNDKIVKCKTIPEMIANLKANKDVVLMGAGSLPQPYLEKWSLPLSYELVAVNVAEPANNTRTLDDEYKPVFSLENPILLRAGNPILVDLLSLCESPADLTEQFNSGSMFLHRIRCAWVPPSARMNLELARNAKNHAASSERAANELLGGYMPKRRSNVRRKTRKTRKN